MSKKLYKSFGYKAVEIVVHTLLSLLLIPILLNYWDLEVYGSWIAIYAFYNLLQVIEFGHSVYVGNEINRIVHAQLEEAKIVLGSALRANFLIGLIQLAIIFAMYYFGLFSFVLDKSIDDKEVALVLGILFLYKMVIGTYRGLIIKIVNPFGFIYKSFQFSFTEKILEFGILTSVAVAGFSLIELAILWFCVKLVYSVIILRELKNLMPEFFPWWKYGDFKIGIKNLKNSLSYGASNFLNRLGNDGIVLIISAFVGTTFLPLFTATRTIINFGLKLSDFFLNPLAPEVINLHVQKKQAKILDIFKSYWFVSSGLLIIGFTVSLFFIEHIFEFWTGGKLEFSMALYCSLAVILLVQNYGIMITTFFTCINKTTIVLRTSVMRMALFFLIAFLFKNYELYGVLLGLFLSELIVAGVYLPYNMFREFDLTGSEKLKYMVNLLTVLCVAYLYYAIFQEKPIWHVVVSCVPILLLLAYQYTLISQESVGLVYRKFSNLSIFAAKKK